LIQCNEKTCVTKALLPPNPTCQNLSPDLVCWGEGAFAGSRPTVEGEPEGRREHLGHRGDLDGASKALSRLRSDVDSHYGRRMRNAIKVGPIERMTNAVF